MDREEMWLAIRNIKELPTLPSVAGQILEIAGDDEAGARELARTIANDQSMSAKVLSLANSAFYGFSRRITTIPQAVVVMGFNAVRGLALGVSAYNSLEQVPGTASFDRQAFWLHSIGCGTAARLVAGELGYKDVGTFFVAGLLHDLGKVVLDTHFNAPYQEVVRKMVDGGRPSVDVEAEVLGVDHAEVGGWLAFRWRFPDILVNPIGHHHNPGAADEAFRKETLIVHLADVLTKQAGIGLCYDSPVAAPSEMVQTHLNLPADRVGQIEEALEGEKEGIAEFFSYLKG